MRPCGDRRPSGGGPCSPPSSPVRRFPAPSAAPPHGGRFAFYRRNPTPLQPLPPPTDSDSLPGDGEAERRRQGRRADDLRDQRRPGEENDLPGALPVGGRRQARLP